MSPVVVDDDSKSIVSKDASSFSKDVRITLSQAMAAPMARQSTTTQQAYFGHRVASVKNVVQDFHAILEEFQDSLHGNNDSAGVVSMRSPTYTSAQGRVQPLLEEYGQDTNKRRQNKAILNRGGRVTFPAAKSRPQQAAYLGRRSACAQNIMKSYTDILHEFNDSTLCLNDSSRHGGAYGNLPFVSSKPGQPSTA
jgi:hypothetical protein